MKILQKNEAILRKKAKAVPVEKITSPETKKVVRGMKAAMEPIEDAVAIAAPQIGAPLRIFVVRGFVLAPKQKKINGQEPKAEEEESAPPDLVCINPEITKRSKEKRRMEEGCLSVRWWYGYVMRAEKATIRAYDETGKPFTRGGSGLLAQIFQHETDHLDGILFTDKAEELKEVKPEKRRDN